ncbi:MAG: hypothetical protein EOM20_04320 [Spartobacteria bacterium]|nr:hypothetical protein [Spartobacteria bacterium]
MDYWRTIYRTAWIVLGIVLVIGGLCIFWRPINQYREYQRREAELEQEKQLEEELIKHLKMQQQRFQNDPRFVEHVAHELGLVKPNETLFKFADEKPGTAPTP